MGDGTILGWGLAAVVGIVALWAERRETRRREATQRPALQSSESDLTDLDLLALNISRYETITRWHREGRPFVRDLPVRDSNLAGGYEYSNEGFGEDISKHYENVFLDIRVQSARNRQLRLNRAIEESFSARLEYVETVSALGARHGLELTVPWWVSHGIEART